MQKCIGSSSEEENITQQSSVAGPSGPSRTTCSKRNPIVYEWKEISSDSKVRGTTACNVCFMVIFCAQKCGCINAKMKKALKCKPLAEFGGNIGIFGLKTTFHAYVLGEHTSIKNEL